MRIVIASIFRNSSSYLPRYFGQVGKLKDSLSSLGHTTRLLLAEGDSTDDTWEELNNQVWLLKSPISELIKVDHGGPVFGSIDNDTRWRNISFVCNALLEHVRPDDDRVIYVESDLIWEPETMLGLLRLVTGGATSVAPMCIHKPTGLCYETWGNRKDGQRFSAYPPYHPALKTLPYGHVIPIDSAGSCIVMESEVALNCRFDPPELGIVGFGQSINREGYGLYLAPFLNVYHP